jgi:ZIP family zinc transporter
VGAALGWGALAASSLLIGAGLALVRRWPDRQVGIVLAFGAGALISAVSFELVQEGQKQGAPGWLALGLAVGALTYFVLAGVVDRLPGSSAGGPLALGALLDGIPEQAVLGIGIASGEGVGLSLLLAIFVSNLPEAIGSASEMQEAKRPGRRIFLLWTVVAVICTLAAVAGYAIAEPAGNNFRAGIDGFAAGALLVMLIDSMIPDATGKAGRVAGLVTTLGFAVAAGLSALDA